MHSCTTPSPWSQCGIRWVRRVATQNCGSEWHRGQHNVSHHTGRWRGRWCRSVFTSFFCPGALILLFILLPVWLFLMWDAAFCCCLFWFWGKSKRVSSLCWSVFFYVLQGFIELLLLAVKAEVLCQQSLAVWVFDGFPGLALLLFSDTALACYRRLVCTICGIVNLLYGRGFVGGRSSGDSELRISTYLSFFIIWTYFILVKERLCKFI